MKAFDWYKKRMVTKIIFLVTGFHSYYTNFVAYYKEFDH